MQSTRHHESSKRRARPPVTASDGKGEKRVSGGASRTPASLEHGTMQLLGRRRSNALMLSTVVTEKVVATRKPFQIAASIDLTVKGDLG